MKSDYSPMLAPNDELKPEDLKYPLLASYKLDGIRCIFKEGQMFSRALKSIPNVQVRKRFQELVDFTTKEKQLLPILDGELLARSIPFTDLSGLIRTLDKPVPDDLYFYIFDVVVDENFDEPFIVRIERAKKLAEAFPHLIKFVDHVMVRNIEDVKGYFTEAVAWGCDGLILRKSDGGYKLGRGTVKEGLIYKLKPFSTFDAEIVEVIQSTVVDPKAAKKINELGRSVTSKKKGDRILIEKACDFVVMHEGLPLKVMIAATDEEKKEIWKNRQSYLGRVIEYKGMLIGAKDLPRHPVFLRFRDDKN